MVQGEQIIGTTDADTLVGTSADDNISGLDGNDRLLGREGDDTISGGNGLDTILGEAGDDRILGESGGDRILGGEGEDTISGGNDLDTILGEAGDDILLGEAGDDLIRGGDNNDSLIGNDGNDTLRGEDGNDTVVGGQGADTILGEAGDDRILGDSGDDVIRGGEGDDFLMGVTGNDTLLGEAGSDTFVLGNDDGTDVVADFELGVDKIGLVEGELTFNDLSILQQGQNQVLEVTGTGERLALVRGLEGLTLTETDFVSVTQDLPVVSFTTSTDSLNEEEGTSLVFNFTVTGDFPEDGIIVRTEENFFPNPQLDFNIFELDGLEFFGFEETASGQFVIDWQLTLPEASLTTAVFDDNIAEPDGSFTTGLLPILSANYTINPDATTATVFVTDGVDGTGGPIVDIAVDRSEVNEGEPLTITLTAEGEIPDDGLEVNVDSDIAAAIGDLVTVDENGNPTITFEGLAGFPGPNGDASGFIATLTSNTATISFNVFDDGPNEGEETFEFTVLDGENYDVADNSNIALTINDGGENAIFQVESGVTSVFLDLPLLEEAAGLTLVGTDSEAEPFSEDFQVGFAITPDTDFSFAPVPFTPLGGSIEHSGNITLDLGGSEVTVGEFSIGFDASRVSETASGFFVTDTLEDPLGLEVLFDLSSPGTINVFGEDLEISEADLLLAPELATALGLPDLTGADVGDARIDAMVALPLVSISIEPDIISEEDPAPTGIINFSVDGVIPDGGLSILVNGELDILDQVDGSLDIGLNNLAVGEFFDPVTSNFELILFENEASITLPILNDVIQEEDRDFTFTVLENDGSVASEYNVNSDANTDFVTLVDGNGGPGIGPSVGFSFSNTELREGEEFTINFSVDGEIPEEGLTLLVDSETPAILGEFTLFDADGNPLFETNGIAGIPEVGDGGASSFLVTITEPNASIVLSVFDDGPNEGLEEFSFSIVDGEIYEVNPDQEQVSFSIDDRIIGTRNDDILLGDELDNTIVGLQGNDTLRGKAGNDRLQGDRGNDRASGGEGDDTLSGSGGQDTLLGEAGNDILEGGNQRDLLRGGEGDDTLSGGNGRDTLLGEAGNDILEGGNQKDLLHGNGGDDTIFGSQGLDTILGEAGDDILAGDGQVDRLLGGAGNDSAFGGNGRDTLRGEAGDDLLSGDGGNDLILGGDGNDSLMGVTGNDTLRGEAGSDTFVFGNGDGTDVIVDFERGVDRIGLVSGELTFDDLSIFRRGQNLILDVVGTGERLAIVRGVNSGTIGEDDFVTVPDISDISDVL